MSGFAVNQIADPTLYGDPQRLQQFYDWLRREHPVAWADPEGFARSGWSRATPISANWNASPKSSTPARA
jgi:hypothetical protein